MRNRRIYGQSRNDSCLFCQKPATVKNKQGVPVCAAHTKTKLNDFKCACGDYLDIRNGKFGLYFVCMHCGNISLSKALELNQVWDENNLPKLEDL